MDQEPKKISQLEKKVTPAAADSVPIYDSSTQSTKRVELADIFTLDNVVDTDQIVDGAVTSDKIESATIQSSNIDWSSFFNSEIEVLVGTGIINVTSTGATSSANVSFPKTFTGTPTVLVQGNSANATAMLGSFSATNESTTGFTVNGRHTSATGNLSYKWIAIYAPTS